MQAVGMLSSYISQGVYTVAGPFHPFGGAVDIIVVRQQDGSFKSSPWYVRFGKFQGVLKSREKIVDVDVNGSPTDFHMYLDRTGEAYFLKDPEPDEAGTILSPPSAASSGDETVDSEKLRGIPGQFMKSVSDGAVIKQGFEIPEKGDVPETPPPQVNSTSTTAASTLADVNSQKLSEINVVTEKPETGMGNSKPPRSLLALMFGSKPSDSLEVAGLSMEMAKEATVTSLDKQNSMESNWSTGKTSNCLSALQAEGRLLDEVFKEVPVTETLHPIESPEKDDAFKRVPVTESFHPTESTKKDEIQANALLVKQNYNLTGETQLSLAGHLSCSSAHEQDALLSQESKDTASDDHFRKAREGGNCSCLRVDVADSMTGNTLAETVDNDQLTSQPSNHDKEKCQFTTIDETSLVDDGNANELPMDSDIELDSLSMSPTSRTIGRVHLVGQEYDCVLQHETPYINKFVDPALIFESPCAISVDVHTSSKPTSCFEVVEEDENPRCKKQEISEAISQYSESIQSIATVKDESACDSEINVEGEDFSIEFNQKENQVLDFTVPAVMIETESFESNHKVPLSINKPLQAFYGFDEGVCPQPHGFFMESCQVLDSSEPEMGNNFMRPTGRQSSNASLSISLSSNEGSNFESPILVPNASTTSGLCEPVIFDGAGQRHDAAELSSPDCKLEISHEFAVMSTDLLAEAPDYTINDFNVGRSSMAGNDSSYPTGMTSNGTGEVDQVARRLEGTLYAKDLERFSSFTGSDSSIVDLEISDNIPRNYRSVEDICSFTDNENEGNCDAGVEVSALLGSSDFRISESEYLLVESGGEGFRKQDDEPIRVRSNPVSIPRVLNQDIPSDVQSYNKRMPSSLPTHLSETSYLKDKCFCSHSLGSIASPFLNMDVDLNQAMDNSYALLSRSSIEGDTHISSEGLDADCPIHVMVDTPGNENDGTAGSDIGVEISLCRHLLTEGMGIEAAAIAFTAEKVLYDVFKCSGREILANDRLVVKIGERYFPWAAAAPLVLGKMVFGIEVPQDAMGAINVETSETKGVKSGASENNVLVPSSGGWRLWPFPFRRSRTSKKDTLPSLPSKAIMPVTEVALESPFTEELIEKNNYYSRHRRPKVRSYVPTSEQLVSLNLKEGPNKVTFTFSTRVLGKQQVDARIYLWKWSTRIVISDVDGTITKSDVLGQFMPLVGKDWTQSGVTRLFSGIKLSECCNPCSALDYNRRMDMSFYF